MYVGRVIVAEGLWRNWEESHVETEQIIFQKRICILCLTALLNNALQWERKEGEKFALVKLEVSFSTKVLGSFPKLFGALNKFCLLVSHKLGKKLDMWRWIMPYKNGQCFVNFETLNVGLFHGLTSVHTLYNERVRKQ